MLSRSVSPDHALMSWSFLQGNYPNLVAAVCLDEYKKSVLPQSIKKYTKKPLNYLVSYFCTENIYFLEDKLLEDMLSNDRVDFPIDYTLMFDTNIASYINSIVHGKSLGSSQAKIISFFDEVLYDDLNFDYLFYLVENVKNIKNILHIDFTSKLSFWRRLDKNFRNNLISLQLFCSIDCQEYKRTSNPKSVLSYREAARNAIDFSYKFYNKKESKELLLSLVTIQRVILLQLIGMVRIQLESNRNTRKKMSDYFDYINNVVGAYFDRESIIAHKYFDDRNKVTVLRPFQKGMPTTGLLKRLDNIAWDMTAPRYMERLIVSLSETERGRYFIPMFVSFDNNLRELLSFFPIKGVMYTKDTGDLMQIPKTSTLDYFEEHGCLDLIENMFRPEVKLARNSMPKHTRETILKVIKREYSKLLRVLDYKNNLK